MNTQIVITNERERAIYAKLQKQYGKSHIIAPASIRTEQSVTNGKQTYTFPMVEDNANMGVTEKRLARTDKLFVSEIGFFLMQRDPATPGAEVLQTYPNATAFTAIADKLTPAHLESFYNGYLTFTVDQVVWITNIDTRRFRFVGEAQQTDATNKSAADGKAGFVELTPQIMIDGDKKNQVQLYTPVQANHLVAGDVTHVTTLVLMFRGFLISPLSK